jgi:hypothetical protein
MAQQGGAQVVGNQIVGNIGMYYAAYRLSQQGWNVMPTARNARGVDLLVYDVRAHIYKGIQVKALSKRIPVPLGKTLDNLMGDWWNTLLGEIARECDCNAHDPSPAL